MNTNDITNEEYNPDLISLLDDDDLGEAVAAVNGAVALGLEGHLGLAAAGSAGSSEQLAGGAGSVLAGSTASLALLGLVLEAAGSVELLLTGGENELLAALVAN